MYAFKLEPKRSAEEYLENERQATHRSEWHAGLVTRMAGASPEHVDIVESVSGQLYLLLRGKPCRTSTHDVRVKTSTSYVYPDVVVTCGERRYTEGDCLTNPLVIVEVLSESTERDDRGWKLTEYRNLPSVQEIIHIYQDRIQVECFRRQEATQWLHDVYIHLEAGLFLKSLGVTLPLQEIYGSVIPESEAGSVPPPEARARYSEPHRRYHTVRHLRAVLAALHRWLGPELPESLRTAALWHDAVYDPRAHDNEEQSAALVQGDSRAALLILATKRHEPLDTGDDMRLLLDADLWILGAAPRTYRRYAQLIRQEYAHVPDDAYRAGRAAVLERFLERPRLYFGSFPEREARARENLSAELSRLRA